MPKIFFHHADGSTDVIDAVPGTSIMRAAITNGVDGIIGQCGGQAVCGTCHVYVREEYIDGLPAMNEDEEEMLEVTSSPRDDQRSRLSCQITVGPSLEEIAVDLPLSQIEP